MATDPKPFITPEEYLKIERKAETKSEYWNGHMYAMAGATRDHARIVTNLVAALHARLKGKGCNVYSSDLRVHIPATGLYAYPDVTIVCGEEQFLDDQFDTLVNPILIVEVLSETTQGYDRGTKFENYRSLRSLIEYLTVAQDRAFIEQGVRQEGGLWLLRDHSGLAGIIHLDSVPDVNLGWAERYIRHGIQMNDPRDRKSVG